MYQDILRDTEIYQIIMQEGVQQQQQKELQDLRQILLGFLQERFSGLLFCHHTNIQHNRHRDTKTTDPESKPFPD